MVVHGTPEEVERPKVLLGNFEAEDAELFLVDAPVASIA